MTSKVHFWLVVRKNKIKNKKFGYSYFAKNFVLANKITILQQVSYKNSKFLNQNLLSLLYLPIKEVFLIPYS